MANYSNLFANPSQVYGPPKPQAQAIQKFSNDLNLNQYGPPVPLGLPTTSNTQSTTGNSYFGDVSNAGINPDLTTAYGNGVSSAKASSPQNQVPLNAPRLASYNGKSYDLANPNDRSNYFNTVIGDVTNRQNQGYDSSLQNLVASRATALGNINQQYGQLDSDKENYLRDLNNQGINFNNQYVQGNSSRSQNAFAGNVFQSGSAQGQGLANLDHDRGLADLQAGQQSYLNDYSRNKNQLDLQKNQFDTQYNNDTTALQRSKEDAINSASDSLKSNLGRYDSLQNIDPATGIAKEPTIQSFDSRYQTNPYTPIAAPKVDLSQLTPYVSSDTLGSSPVAQQAGQFLASPTSKLTPQDQYFGYQPTSQDQNYISNYFKTGNPNPTN